jgi:two-component system, OmpR family, sensor histidine kinase BaeS
LDDAEPIVVDGETVGYVITTSNYPARDKLEEAYLNRINQMLLSATVGAVTLALLLSFLFARSLSKPLHEIASAIKSLAHGNLEQQVPVRSRDEVGQVAIAFNQMSVELAQANRLRRQMTADIAHELRTPLSVLVGYLESVREGLLKPNPERFKIIHEEARHLQVLVDDLRTLSLADAGELHLNEQWIAPEELISLTAAAFSHQAEQQHITLSVCPEPDLPLLYADPDRLLQVLSNLVSNALRHTPDQGKITLTARKDAERVVLSIQDTGSGIEPEHLPHIFERFYRADASRHQNQNESGLGLAITKSFVEAHGGTISASSNPGEGTTITIQLPVKDDSDLETA